MTVQGPSALYSQGFGTTFEKVEIPFITNRAPTIYDGVNPPMPLGKRWVNTSNNRTYSLTSFNSAGGAVTANWEASSLPSSVYPVTSYVVGPVGVGGYQTIQSAINAAHAAGGGAVYIQPATYTENLTLYTGVSLVGTAPINPFSFAANVVIIGTHTPPTSGSIYAQNIVFKAASRSFYSASAGTTQIVFKDCGFTLTGSGASIDLDAWTGRICFDNCTNSFPIYNITTVADGIVKNSTGTAEIVFKNSQFLSAFVSPLIANGAIEIFNSIIYTPIQISGSQTLSFLAESSSLMMITITAESAQIWNCNFFSSSYPSITYSAASPSQAIIANCTFESSATNVIAGTGTGLLTLSDLAFSGASDGIANTLTILWASTKTGDMYVANKLHVTTGTDASCGTSAAMTTGSVTVATTAITANSQVHLTPNTLGTVTKPQALYVSARTAGTSFTITSADATDTSTVDWLIVN
jgi:hypothetical protein